MKCFLGLHKWNKLTNRKRECLRCGEYQEYFFHADGWFKERHTPLTGVELIANERQRQIATEGWAPEHDDFHIYGDLAKAAACYAVHHTDALVLEGDADAWPWSKNWDKRDSGSHVRNLVKAGALIAAEIDRMQRRDD